MVDQGRAPAPGEISILLTMDEAMVLFGLLQRYTEKGELAIEDQAEQRALWNLTCLLESQLSQPFTTEWEDALEAAKSRLRD